MSKKDGGSSGSGVEVTAGVRLVSRTIRRKPSCCRSRLSLCIGKDMDSLPREIRQEQDEVAHRNQTDQFAILGDAKMADMRLGHQIVGI